MPPEIGGTPAPAPAAGSVAAPSAIYDLGYRGYDGPRLGRRAAVWALFASSFRATWGLGRSGRAKIVPWGALAFISLPAIVQSAVNATVGPVAGAAAGGLTFDNYLAQMNVLAFIFLAAQAPELLGSDLRNRVLALYFAHAMERLDYALAKLAAILAGLLVLTVVPTTILFFGLSLGSADLVQGFKDQLGYVPEIIGAALIYSLLYARWGWRYRPSLRGAPTLPGPSWPSSWWGRPCRRSSGARARRSATGRCSSTSTPSPRACGTPSSAAARTGSSAR